MIQILISPNEELKNVLKEKFEKLVGINVENVKVAITYPYPSHIFPYEDENEDYRRIVIFPVVISIKDDAILPGENEIMKVVELVKNDIFELISKLHLTVEFENKNIGMNSCNLILDSEDARVCKLLAEKNDIIKRIGKVKVETSYDLSDSFDELENYIILKTYLKRIEKKLNEFRKNLYSFDELENRIILRAYLKSIEKKLNEFENGGD